MIDIAEATQLAPKCEQPPFPDLVENGFVWLRRDRPETVHATHVVDAVHGAITFAVPIMESRVTSAASCSSPRCSVRAGRSGTTR